jgi:hypothetical protein
MRPRPPPRSPRLFSECEQGGGFGERTLLAQEFAFERFAAFLFSGQRLAQPLDRHGVAVGGLLAGLPPGLDLFGIQALLAAILGEFGFVQGGRLHDDRELPRRGGFLGRFRGAHDFSFCFR